MTVPARRCAVRRLVGTGERFAAGGALDLTRADRRRVGVLIDALIALLDEDAGDPDLEDGDLDRCLAGEDGPRTDPAFDAGWRNAA